MPDTSVTTTLASPITHSKLNQAVLIRLFIAYINIKNPNDSLSILKKSILKFGLCYGFSIVHSYMAAIDKLDWWKALLICISQWDKNEASLQTIITLPNENKDKPDNEKTVDYYFIQAINFVFFHQAINWQNGIRELNQADLLADSDPHWFDSPEGKIRHRKFFTEENLTVEKLEILLAPELFSLKNTLFLVSFFYRKMGCLVGHCCSLRYDSQLKKWHYYDSANPEGEASFSDIATLYFSMTTQYGTNIEIEIASFDSAFQSTNTDLLRVFSRKEKLRSLYDQLQYLERYYKKNFNEDDQKGFENGFFGKYFSFGARLKATRRLLEAVRSLQDNPATCFDKTQFGAAERNGKLGVIFKKLKEIGIENTLPLHESQEEYSSNTSVSL